MVKYSSVRALEAEKTTKTKWELNCGTPCTLIFPAFMYWMNMYSEITLCCCKIFTLLARILYSFMNRLLMLCQTVLQREFFVTLITLVLDILMNWIDVMLQTWLFYKVISTFSASMLLSKMFGFVVIVIISLFGENFIAKVAKYGSHFLPYLFSTLMVTVKRIKFFL